MGAFSVEELVQSARNNQVSEQREYDTDSTSLAGSTLF